MALFSKQGSNSISLYPGSSLIAMLIAFTMLAPANAQLANYETYVGDLSPTEFLRLNNDLINQGSIGSTFETNPVAVSGFSPDFEGNLDSALSIGSSEQGIRTTTDVIAPAGSLSFLFKTPDFDTVNKPEGFSADRYIFDGGVDSGNDNDGFFLRWDNDAIQNDLGTANDIGALEFRVGNFGVDLPNSNIEATPNTWYYFGATWDKSLTASAAGGEVRAVLGALGGTATTTALNISNGTGSVIGDDGNFYIGNRGTGTDNVRPDFDNDSFRQSVTGFDTREGVIDNFAIWNNRALSAAQLELQFNSINGSLPTFSAPGTDTFADGSRAVDPGGLNWYAIDAGSSGPRPILTVEDDSAGIGDGFALFADAGSSNSDVQAVFDTQAVLGSELGDTLTLAFDFRLQALPTASTTSAEVRFGLLEDSDDQFGTDGWGSSDGNFDTTAVGARGDNGIYARVGIDASGTQSGERTRIIETTNFADNMGGSSNGGLADDTVAEGLEGTFGVIDDLGVHAFELKLKRVNATEDGETVQLTLRMDENGDGIFESLLIDIDADSDDIDSVHVPGDGIAGDIAAQSIFDYFSIKTTQNIDWILDNFSITNGNEISAGDFNGDGTVDAADFALWRDNLGNTDESAIGNNGDGGGITINDYQLWAANYGLTASSSASSSAVPEPTSASLLILSLAALASKRSRKA